MSFKLTQLDLHKPTAKWYSDYLQSLKWKEFRVRIIAERGPHCEKCTVLPHHVLHHLTYIHLFNEWRADVLLLCKKCHKKAHESKVPYAFLIYEVSLEFVTAFLSQLNYSTQTKQKGN